MKKVFLMVLFCAVNVLPVMAGQITLGEQLQLTEVTKIYEINAEPEKYLGKRVRVEGLIIDVCSARGCWVDLASDVPFEKIQVKVVDGEIVFPMEAKGRTAIVEGVVEMLQLNEEQSLMYAEHLALERGEIFDQSTVKGPMKIFRIRGEGARIL